MLMWWAWVRAVFFPWRSGIQIIVSIGCLVSCVLEFWMVFEHFLTLSGVCVVSTIDRAGLVLLVLFLCVLYAKMCTVLLSAGFQFNDN
jgi:hypothetical protein